MEINLKHLQIYTWRKEFSKGIFIRLFGYGLEIRNKTLTMREKNGYKKFLSVTNGYQVSFFRRSK